MRCLTGLILCVSTSVLASVQAMAAAPAEIVVTGQGLPASLGESAFDVRVIGHERLAGSAARRLEDVLRDIGGFHQFRRADSRSAHPTNQGISLRGLGGNAAGRVQVLLDGVPVADPFGGWIDWPSLDPSRLGYVRVTRGGAAGPLGAGALAGAIELSSMQREHLATVDAGIAYGSRDSVIADAALAADLGAGFATVSGRFDRGDGFVPIEKRARGLADHGADYQQWNTRVRAVVPVGDAVEMQASALLFGDKRNRGTLYTNNETTGADASLRLIGRGEWAWELSTYLQSRQFSSQFAAVAADRNSVNLSLDQYNTPATGWGVRAELRPPIATGADLRVGLDYRELSGRTKELFSYAAGVPTRSRVAGGTIRTAGAFAEAAVPIAEAVIATASGRVDRWQIDEGFLREAPLSGAAAVTETIAPSRKHWEASGRAGIAYQPAGAITLRAAGYAGYRLPTLNELYRPFRVGRDGTAANSALKPERLKGVEAGIAYQPITTARVAFTLFWNKLDNAIANVTRFGGGGFCAGVGMVGDACRQRDNLKAIRSRGVEVDGSLAFGQWAVDLSYAFADAKVRADGAALPLAGRRPAQTARHQAGLTLGWKQADGAGVALTGRYVSGQFEDDFNQRRLDDAATLDATAILPLAAGLTVEARAENLTNAVIETAVSASGVVERAMPRTLWIGLRYKLR